MAAKKDDKKKDRKDKFIDDGVGGTFWGPDGKVIKPKDDKKKKSSLRDQAIRLASERPAGDPLKKALIAAVTED